MIATKMQHNTTRIAVVAITVTFRNKYMQAENADAIPAIIPQDELGSVHPQHLRLPLLDGQKMKSEWFD
jgi:hypothetical protein